MLVCACVSVCVFVYALRQAECCVKAWLGPAASQEDRRGSRWTGLDLTLPTPFYPPGPPLPTCTSLFRIKAGQQSMLLGGGELCLILLVAGRDS